MRNFIIIAGVVLMAYGVQARAEIFNADFADDFTPSNPGEPPNWVATGSVKHVQFTNSSNVTNGIARFFEEESGSTKAGFARLVQAYDNTLTTPMPTLPDNNHFTFRYRFTTVGAARNLELPPDAFVVRLTGAGNVALPNSYQGMTWTNAVFYHATDTGPLFDGSIVTLAGPDAEGFYSVAVNAAALPTESVVIEGTPTSVKPMTIEFGFVYSDNNQRTQVDLDGIIDGCPDGFCCSQDLLIINRLDDGLECTDDKCDTIVENDPNSPQTGYVIHTEDGGCCPECREGTEALVVLMIDRTGSVDYDQIPPDREEGECPIEAEGKAPFHLELDAAREFVDAFRNLSPRPHIAIGSFNDAAIIEPNGGLTTDYGSPGDENTPPSGLFAVIEGIQCPDDATDIEEALYVAQGEIDYFANSNQGTSYNKYIVLISDGQPTVTNGVSGGVDCSVYQQSGGCDSINAAGCGSISGIGTNAWCHAHCRADYIKLDEKYKIFGILFDTSSEQALANCQTAFMRDVIASDPPDGASQNPYFLDASSADAVVLRCAIYDIIETISCEGKQCIFGQCVDY